MPKYFSSILKMLPTQVGQMVATLGVNASSSLERFSLLVLRVRIQKIYV